MATDEATGGIAVAERTDVQQAAPEEKRGWFRRKRNEEKEEEVEHELELMTPFGKVELEFEPTPKKEARDRKRREKAEKEAAKAEAKKQEKRSKKAEKRAAAAASGKSGGGAGRLVLILLVIGLIAGAIAVAIWLFGRDPATEQVPEEYRAREAEPEPQGFMDRARTRIRHAVRAGQDASREAQVEQQQRYEDLTHPS
jgi:hypothetical protein